jgi:plasmid stability protein
MAELKIRDVSDATVAFYRQRAKAKGLSLEEELRQTLTETQMESRRQVLAELDAFREQLGAKYGIMPDSTPGIRAERDGEPDA